MSRLDHNINPVNFSLVTVCPSYSEEVDGFPSYLLPPYPGVLVSVSSGCLPGDLTLHCAVSLHSNKDPSFKYRVQSVGCEMENFDTIAESVVGAIIKQACQGVEDRLGECEQ